VSLCLCGDDFRTDVLYRTSRRSAFSFLERSSLPEDLAVSCRLQMPAMALLDADGVYGARAFTCAKKLGIKAHIEAEVTAFLQETRRHGEYK